MKNTIIFSLIFCAFCTFAPLTTLLVGCNKVEAKDLTDMTWNDSLAIIGDIPYMITLDSKVEFRNKFYYHTHQSINHVLQGILISESDYPIFICERENLFIGEEYNLNINNISQPLQTYCRTLQQFEAHIYPTNNPSEYKIWFGGWDKKKQEYSFFKSFIIIT